MTAFNIDLSTDQPDRIFAEVDGRFNVAIERDDTGLTLRVYPRTDGELWDFPFTTFDVDETEIAALKMEMDSVLENPVEPSTEQGAQS
jgi:hypothetical protein